MQITELVDVRTGALKGARATVRGHTRMYFFLPPMLPASFRRLLDFDALARAAGQSRQEAQAQRRGSPRSVELRDILKPDVSRTEELLLTRELSRHDEWRVENLEAQTSDDQAIDGGFLCLRPESSGLIEVYCFQGATEDRSFPPPRLSDFGGDVKNRRTDERYSGVNY